MIQMERNIFKKREHVVRNKIAVRLPVRMPPFSNRQRCCLYYWPL